VAGPAEGTQAARDQLWAQVNDALEVLRAALHEGRRSTATDLIADLEDTKRGLPAPAIREAIWRMLADGEAELDEDLQLKAAS
jgi:hypothetical protein